jgi:signal peptidase II
MSHTRARILKAILIALIVLMNIGCDQATKHIARARLADRGTVSVVGSVFILRYVENEGAFLSLGAGLSRPVRTVVFIAIPLAALVGMIVVLARRRASAWTLVAGFSFIAGGGFGNLIDRLARGGRVSDFMNLGIGSFRTGIFNFADLSILIGCLLVLLSPWAPSRPADR